MGYDAVESLLRTTRLDRQVGFAGCCFDYTDDLTLFDELPVLLAGNVWGGLVIDADFAKSELV